MHKALIAVTLEDAGDHRPSEQGVSALTGHLALSTLHTNTAPATITCMLDLGVDCYPLRASLLRSAS